MTASAYATTTELARRAPAKALSGVSTDDQTAALADASALADDFLAGRYALPLATWGGDLTRAVCAIALYDILSKRGFGAPGDATLYKQRADEARAWLEKVQTGAATLTRNVAPAASPATRVATSTRRGWPDGQRSDGTWR